MLFAVKPSRQFIRTEFHFPLSRSELGAEGDGKFSFNRRRILLHASTTGPDEFALNSATKNQLLARAEMGQVDLQGDRQVVFRLTTPSKGPIEFAHLFHKLEIRRRGFNVINRNSHGRVGVLARAHGSMNPLKKQRRHQYQQSS